LRCEEDHYQVIHITDQTVMYGDEFFEAVKEESEVRYLEKKKALIKGNSDIILTTPHLDQKGQPHRMLAPVFVLVDSFTQLQIEAVMNKTLDSNNVGDSKTSMFDMGDGRAKTHLIAQLPRICMRGDIIWVMTGHVGSTPQLDMYAPVPQSLVHSRRGAAPKGMSKRASYIANNYLEIFGAPPLYAKGTKEAQFPLTSRDREKGAVDLSLIKCVNVRNKNGPSGIDLAWPVSQEQGIELGLPEFFLTRHLKREHKDFKGSAGFGFVGNDQTAELEFYPGHKLGRTNVREKLASDEKLRRAMVFNAELCQFLDYWKLPDELRLNPNQIMEKLDKKGIKMDNILNTNSFWTFREYESHFDKKYFGTYDLMRLAADLIEPPEWMV